MHGSTEELPFGINATHDNRYTLTATRPVCASTGNLHGGVAAAAAAAIAAHATGGGGAVRVVSARYHRPCPEGSTIELRFRRVRTGRRWSATSVTATVDDSVGFQADVLAGEAAAARGSITSLTMPAVAPPDSCPPRELKPEHAGTFPSTVDWRMAATGPGLRTAWWARPQALVSPLAQIACSDILARSTNQVVPHVDAGISLDHTYRAVNEGNEGEADKWCLYVVDVLAVLQDAVHGQISVWSEAGSLLGIATQTCIATPIKPG